MDFVLASSGGARTWVLKMGTGASPPDVVSGPRLGPGERVTVAAVSEVVAALREAADGKTLDSGAWHDAADFIERDFVLASPQEARTWAEDTTCDTCGRLWREHKLHFTAKGREQPPGKTSPYMSCPNYPLGTFVHRQRRFA